MIKKDRRNKCTTIKCLRNVLSKTIITHHRAVLSLSHKIDKSHLVTNKIYIVTQVYIPPVFGSCPHSTDNVPHLIVS